mmetsp:Transcript_17493/g.24543  ORF Transcript_17493/g.24543 Transcript_17493/m.24543 type:complete len:236 (+) Transcript_17493:818-1525(+)
MGQRWQKPGKTFEHRSDVSVQQGYWLLGRRDDRFSVRHYYSAVFSFGHASVLPLGRPQVYPGRRTRSSRPHSRTGSGYCSCHQEEGCCRCSTCFNRSAGDQPIACQKRQERQQKRSQLHRQENQTSRQSFSDWEHQVLAQDCQPGLGQVEETQNRKGNGKTETTGSRCSSCCSLVVIVIVVIVVVVDHDDVIAAVRLFLHLNSVIRTNSTIFIFINYLHSNIFQQREATATPTCS